MTAARLEHALRVPGDDDSAEHVVESNDEETLTGLRDRAFEDAALLRRAIERIDAGTYGTCVECGGHISPARLFAVPTADRCIGCALLT